MSILSLNLLEAHNSHAFVLVSTPNDVVSVDAGNSTWKNVRNLTFQSVRDNVESMKHEMIVQDEQGTSQVGRRVAVMLYTHLRWDQHMMNHSLRVALYAKWLARKLGLPDTDVKRVEIAAIVHDIGKLRVPSHILSKPGKLTLEEWEVVKRHPQDSRDILQEIPSLRAVAQLTAYHHECWDGSGYPYGLSGRDIPVESRIISIADAYDAMTSRRAYRSEMSKEQAVHELIKGAGSQFWPAGVDAFLEVLHHCESNKCM